MPNFRRGIYKSDKKADSEMKTQSQQEKCMYLRTPIKRIPIEGYVTIRNILSDHTAIPTCGMNLKSQRSGRIFKIFWRNIKNHLPGNCI